MVNDQEKIMVILNGYDCNMYVQAKTVMLYEFVCSCMYR